MSNQQSDFNAINSKRIAGGSFKMREFFNKVLFHWPLFVLFLIITFTIAVIYINYSKPLFNVQAKILIKDPGNEKTEGVALEELNLTASSKSVDTEIGLLTSIPNIEQVVEDLKLWITYSLKTTRFTYKDVYSSTPFKFKLVKAGGALRSQDLDILIRSESSFSIKQSYDTSEVFMFKNELKNNFGIWKLDTTSNLKSYIGKTIRIHLENPKEVVKMYQDKISALNIIKTNPVIDLSIDDEVPERGRAILNDLLRVYTAASIEDKRKSTQNTLQFVDDRLASLTGELNAVEKDYEGYKSSRGITEISDQSTKYLNDVENTDNKLNEINMQLTVLDGIQKYVNSDQGEDNPPATIGMNDPGLIGLIKQLSDLQLQRTRMLATLPESNPLFNPIKQQISATRVAIKENLKGIRQSLINSRNQIQSIGNTYETSIRNIPGQERDLVNIKRMQGIKENLYVYLLQKKEQISLDYASTISDARIVEQAHYGPQKSPVPSQDYAIAFLLGLLLPAGLIYGRDAIKNRVTSKNEIIFETGLPVLSELIFEENADQIQVISNNYLIGEQFRDLRTNVNYIQRNDGKGKITLLTSSISGEGKSFVSSNLATTLAVSGKKTILIEVDMRRPKLGDVFGLGKDKPGISDFLHGDAKKAEIIKQLPVSENLFLIDCGKIPPNPSELLESNTFSVLLEELRKEYDHILIDSPPVHLVTDAMIIAPMVDVTLYVIRQAYTPKHELEYIRDLYVSKKLPKMNLIFNGIRDNKYGNGHHYYKNSYYKPAPKKLKTEFKRFLERF